MKSHLVKKSGGISITKETVKVEGMACGHCVMAVKKAIENLEGVRSAEVDLGKKEAVVEYDREKTDLDKIRASVREAGYKA